MELVACLLAFFGPWAFMHSLKDLDYWAWGVANGISILESGVHNMTMQQH